MVGESRVLHGTSDVWRRADAVAEVAYEQRRIVLPLAEPTAAAAVEPLLLRGSALAVWLTIDGVRTTDEIVSVVATGYGQRAADIRADVVACLQSFREHGLATTG